MNVLEYIVNSIKLYGFNDKAYKYIGEKVDWVEAYLVFIVFGILNIPANILLNKQFFDNIYLYSFLTITTTLLGPFIFYGMIYLFFKILGGKAKFVNFIKYCLSIGVLVGILNTIIGFIVILTIPKYGRLPEYLGIPILVLSILFTIYSLVVIVKTLSKSQKVSNSRGFMAIFIFPIIATIALFIFLVFIMTIGVLIGGIPLESISQ